MARSHYDAHMHHMYRTHPCPSLTPDSRCAWSKQLLPHERRAGVAGEGPVTAGAGLEPEAQWGLPHDGAPALSPPPGCALGTVSWHCRVGYRHRKQALGRCTKHQPFCRLSWLARGYSGWQRRDELPRKVAVTSSGSPTPTLALPPRQGLGLTSL